MLGSRNVIVYYVVTFHLLTLGIFLILVLHMTEVTVNSEDQQNGLREI